MRARRLNPRLLDAVAKIAGRGALARTGSKASRVLLYCLRRRGLMHGMAEKTAANQQKLRGLRYRHCALKALGDASVVSVSMDATRMAGLETMYSALWSSERDIGCWGNPMVRISN